MAKVADRLCAEFGYAIDAEAQDEMRSQLGELQPGLFGDLLSPGDEKLIAAARESLGRLALALGSAHGANAPKTAISALLDGAALVMRSELVAGNRVSALMPSFVLLIALSSLDQDEALALSRRASSLLEEAIG